MRLLPLVLASVTPLLLQAQAAVGSLLYADPVGRGIRLTVVEGGGPDRMTLRHDRGDEERLRKRVLAMAGPERFPVAEVQALVDPVPAAWRVEGRSGGGQVRAGAVTYWRYLPGQVLPVRFLFDRKTWTLQEAELPARRFPGPP